MENNNTQNLNAPVLITGSGGFMGKNLVANLHAQGYNNLLLFDLHSPAGALEEYASKASFVFHLAGVNRPKNPAEFYSGNADLTTYLLGLLQQAGNKATVAISSSAQAGNGTDYAKSKEAAEAAALAYGKATGAKVYPFRLPGVFGKWARPGYNSVVATFCHNVANNLPIEVRDPTFELPLCYIDDVVGSFCALLQGHPASPAADGFFGIDPTYTVQLGQIASLVQSFAASRKDLMVPNMEDTFVKKLYSTYLSYLPEDSFSYPLTMHSDKRGSFTEFLRTKERGQVSVNLICPGVTKGNHWHNTKNEKFLVARGTALVKFRKLGSDEVLEYTVNGSKLEVIDIPTGYTHNIANIGQDDVVAIMWANEVFDPHNPDTWAEEV